jgi:hypothetical protein
MRSLCRRMAMRLAFMLGTAALVCVGCAAGDDPPPGDRWLKLAQTIPLPLVEGRIYIFAFD